MMGSLENFNTLCRICSAVIHGRSEVVQADTLSSGNLLSLAERHRVVAMLASRVTCAGSRGIQRRALILGCQSVRFEKELKQISCAFSEANLSWMVLKGPALSRQAYQDPLMRTYDDLDIWVSRAQVDAALSVFYKIGYQPISSVGNRHFTCVRRAGIEFSLMHPEHNRLVELVYSPASLMTGNRVMRSLYKNCIKLDLGGFHIPAPMPLHAFLLAALHGAHHGWDRLLWLVDLAGLWIRFSPAECEDCCRLAQAWNMSTPVGLGLKLATDYLDLNVQGRAAVLINQPRVKRLAEIVGLDRIKPDSPRTPMPERLWMEGAVQDSRMAFLKLMAHRLFVPSLADIQRVPLPPMLYPLYTFIRPIRLLRHPWLSRWRQILSINRSRRR